MRQGRHEPRKRQFALTWREASEHRFIHVIVARPARRRIAKLRVADQRGIDRRQVIQHRARTEEVHRIEQQTEVGPVHVAHHVQRGGERVHRLDRSKLDRREHPALARHLRKHCQLVPSPPRIGLHRHRAQPARAELGHHVHLGATRAHRNAWANREALAQRDRDPAIGERGLELAGVGGIVLERPLRVAERVELRRHLHRPGRDVCAAQIGC